MATYVTITSTTSYVDTEFNTLSIPADFCKIKMEKRGACKRVPET